MMNRIDGNPRVQLPSRPSKLIGQKPSQQSIVPDQPIGRDSLNTTANTIATNELGLAFPPNKNGVLAKFIATFSKKKPQTVLSSGGADYRPSLRQKYADSRDGESARTPDDTNHGNQLGHSDRQTRTNPLMVKLQALRAMLADQKITFTLKKNEKVLHENNVDDSFDRKLKLALDKTNETSNKLRSAYVKTGRAQSNLVAKIAAHSVEKKALPRDSLARLEKRLQISQEREKLATVTNVRNKIEKTGIERNEIYQQQLLNLRGQAKSVMGEIDKLRTPGLLEPEPKPEDTPMINEVREKARVSRRKLLALKIKKHKMLMTHMENLNEVMF